MPGNPDDRKGFSLRRWSQLKLDAARDAPGRTDLPAAEARELPRTSDVESAGDIRGAPLARMSTAPAATVRPAPTFGDTPGARPRPAEPARSQPNAADTGAALPKLPALDSLTIDSDYSGFMQPGVDDSLKCGALKKLFSDPRFNVMDGLDVYIDDYSKPSPLDPDVARTLVQARYIFNPPPTRVTAEGYVEDIPEEELQAAAAEAEPVPAEPAVAECGALAALPIEPDVAAHEALVPPALAHSDVPIGVDARALDRPGETIAVDAPAQARSHPKPRPA